MPGAGVSEQRCLIQVISCVSISLHLTPQWVAEHSVVVRMVRARRMQLYVDVQHKSRGCVSCGTSDDEILHSTKKKQAANS